MTSETLLKELFVADPDLAAEVMSRFSPEDVQALSVCLEDFIADSIWSLGQENAFGRTVAHGYVDLVQGRGSAEQLKSFHRYIREFGERGPALGKIMAEHLVPVLKMDDDVLLKRFITTTVAMLEKGAYTLYGPFKVISDICRTGDKASILAYLDLLKDTFSLPLTYKQCRPFTYTLPKAVSSFSRKKRVFQTAQLRRVINADFSLSDKFLEGLSRGLHLLTEATLDAFVSQGLEKIDQNYSRCAKFLSLESKMGLDTFTGMQVTVPLSQVRPAISRYIKARTGFPVMIKAFSSLPKQFWNEIEVKGDVFSDGKCIYLPDEISRFEEKQKNIDLFKILAKLEAGLFEFGTFDFDFEKLVNRLEMPHGFSEDKEQELSDLERFIHGFQHRKLASCLFTIFEHARIKQHLAACYPGLMRRSMPLLRLEYEKRHTPGESIDVLELMYRKLVLDEVPDPATGISEKSSQVYEKAVDVFDQKMKVGADVETSAELVFEIYPDMAELQLEFYRLKTPFGRTIIPSIYFSALRRLDQLALMLKRKLAENGIRVYRSEVKKKLIENDGSLSLTDVKELALSFADNVPAAGFDLLKLDLSTVLNASDMPPALEEEFTGPAFYYREWDNLLGDYLHNHTRVCQREIPGSESDFYEKTLDRYSGLIKQIRYAFELLKPEGLTILRQCVEGDQFDYRALLDFAVDKKAGIIPSDRLYIKRIKQQRDVAVLLLVDLSRSTANTVIDSAVSVLDVEKEAIVLFCEALEVVGDAYAIVGFSGTGRLGVDYFIIKSFDDILDDRVRKRINAMCPQRSTRMGAAIRHAAAQLEDVSSKVKLLIVIGDGFPNDVDYKKGYALDDTRKAIAEARSKNIHTHALTVNISQDPKLDDLYGNVHHNVISDVRELPDKLPRIYSTLTRY